MKNTTRIMIISTTYLKLRWKQFLVKMYGLSLMAEGDSKKQVQYDVISMVVAIIGEGCTGEPRMQGTP